MTIKPEDMDGIGQAASTALGSGTVKPAEKIKEKIEVPETTNPGGEDLGVKCPPDDVVEAAEQDYRAGPPSPRPDDGGRQRPFGLTAQQVNALANEALRYLPEYERPGSMNEIPPAQGPYEDQVGDILKDAQNLHQDIRAMAERIEAALGVGLPKNDGELDDIAKAVRAHQQRERETRVRPGDLVVLRCGGPVMVVEQTQPHPLAPTDKKRGLDVGTAIKTRCFNVDRDGDIEHDTYLVDSLVVMAKGPNHT